MKTSRQIVVEALCHMEDKDAWSNIALDSALNRSELSLQDKSFASALFYGTLTRKYTIDLCISAHSKKSIKKMDSIIRNILLTGFYQLLYMDSVPDHAAVDEAVEMCKKFKKSSASGFVNAILRSFLRAKKEIPSPKKQRLSHALAVQYSCPPELIDLFLETYGNDDTVKILESSLKAPPVFLRVNTTKNTAEELSVKLLASGIKTKQVAEVPNCLEVTEGAAVQTIPEYKDGLFHIQDISSQRAALVLDVQPGHRVLDACAAPGGKTFVIAQELGNTGEVAACDIYKHRVDEINRRLKSLGLTNITTKVMDMTEYNPELGEFDRVICDAPCSGYGIIRRSPEIKYQLPSEFTELPQLQLKLLLSASKYCKKGGLLVYSTCTLSPHENGEVVENFLRNSSDFEVVDKENPLGKTILMGELGGDGFFYTVFKRS